MLQAKLNHSWIDPREAADDEDLLYRYKIGWAHAQAVDEILKMIEEFINKAAFLEAKQKGEEVNKFKIGG